MSGLLGPRGQNWVELGGDRCWVKNGITQQFIKGDIVVSYQWLHVPGKREQQPCMAMFPVRPKLDGGAYAIEQDAAYEYVDGNGNPTPHLMVAAYNAATMMGFYPDESTVFRIVDVITDGLPDLVRMPSDPPGALDLDRIAHGIEGTVKADGQVIHTEVI